jgi:hypothetical protein
VKNINNGELMMEIASFPQTEGVVYTNARDRLVTGDLVFCAGTSPFNMATQKVTGSVWSHVAFLVRVPELEEKENLVLFEADDEKGVWAAPFDEYVRDNVKADGSERICVARHSDGAALTEVERARLLEFAAGEVDTPYDDEAVWVITAQHVLNDPQAKAATSEAFRVLVSNMQGHGRAGAGPRRRRKVRRRVRHFMRNLEDAMKHLNETIKNNRAYVCSEFVTACFHQVGIEFIGTKTEIPTPADIAANPKVRPLLEILPG